MALIAYLPYKLGKNEIIGIARYVAVTNLVCEFSLSVSDSYSAHGVGRNLMLQLINYAKTQRLQEMVGYILSNNSKMLTFVKELGFEISQIDLETDFRKATLKLNL